MSDPDSLTSLLKNCVSEDDFVDRPIWGYSASAFLAGPDGRLDEAKPSLSFCIGSSFTNWIRIDSSLAGLADTYPSPYQAMRFYVLVLVGAFCPDWCQAGPLSLQRYTDFELYVRPPMSLDWMIYLCPTLAAMVTPPIASWRTILERFVGGGMFMAATEDLFDPDNSTHLAAARAIHRRIEPLNFSVPFNGSSGRSPRA